MVLSDSTAIPDPATGPHAGGSPTFGPTAPSVARLWYWSLRRELWEHRWTYIVPLIVAALFLLGFVIAARSHSPHALVMSFDFASGAVMAAYVIITVIYCLEALHGERRDRSILFWKSLPVSDATTVIAKASMPLLVLPLMTFAIIVVTQGVMLLEGSLVLIGRGMSAAPLWSQTPLVSMWAAMLYHLLTVHALYYAPIYGWLLLVSAWARRAPFLWASLPIAAVLIIEHLVFNSSGFAHLLLSRLGGGPAAIPYPPPSSMLMEAPTLGNLAAFLTSPGLWVGLAVCAIFLSVAVQLRRYQGPI